ncbi:hypothetical protein SDC9_212647 [bioreactor metagenome]|uniref:Uncharacterized protein n=1 Tax=bioreactor metagenome TaxID=1076179 RepID=A0A645JQ70_9ZZZZ
MLERHVLVLHALGLLFGFRERRVHVHGHIDLIHFAARTAYARARLNALFECACAALRVDAHLGEQLADESAVLHEHGVEQMLLLDLSGLIFDRNALRAADGFERFLRKFLYIHMITSIFSISEA